MKQETLESVEQLLINDYKKVVGEELNKYELQLIKWLAASAKKYSEEEVLEIIRQYALEEHLITSSKPDVWFEQFKKK